MMCAIPLLFLLLALSIQVIAYRPEAALSRQVQKQAAMKLRHQGEGILPAEPAPRIRGTSFVMEPADFEAYDGTFE